MRCRCFFSVLSLGLLLAIVPLLRAGDAGAKITGVWKTKGKGVGFDLGMTIANGGGKWTVQGTIEKNGVVVGTFVGENFMLVGERLKFQRRFTKKPADNWEDSDEVTLALDGDTLVSGVVTKNGKKNERFFVRVAAAAKSVVEPSGKEPEKSKSQAKSEQKAADSSAAGDKFSGMWKGSVANHDEIWTIKRSDDTWTINGRFRRNGEVVGSFIGTDIQEAKGALTFTRTFVKAPASGGWQDRVIITMKSEGGNLTYTWSAGKQKGTRALEKYVDEKSAGEKEDDLGKFRGSWVADVATGFRVVMQIDMNKDKIQVAANYYNKKGLLTGNFVGIDAALKDGKLTFSQKFIKKPVSSWHDGKLHTLSITSENVLRFTWEGGGTESFARLKK
jgi:hypothetical protein